MKTKIKAVIRWLFLSGLAGCALAQAQNVTAHFDVVSESGAGKHADSSEVVIWLSPATRSVVEPKPVSRPPRLIQKNKMFHPHILAVTAGSAVEFPNHDPFFHNVFSLFEGKRFDLGLYEAGGSRIVHFDRPGICYIFCNIHPEMSAVIVVVDTPYYGISDAGGNVTLRNVDPGDYVMHVWYEGATPEQLKMLTHPVRVSLNTRALGSMRIMAGPSVLLSHKNKYGRDYDPPAPASPIYVQP
ncbi:MAG TPA: hypothetical protein VFI95_03690 [Terriglobales bacterium]|nr:hypothetical protein [Terriglobales bacterium]